MDNPEFSFHNLPSFFSGSASGVISGIPTEKGSYSVEVKFSGKSGAGSEDIILRVNPSLNSYSNLWSLERKDLYAENTSKEIILEPTDDADFISKVGDLVKLRFVIKNGISPYLFTATNLPYGFSIDKHSGEVSGYAKETGHFLFGVLVADANGRAAEAFLTLNVQPKTSLKTYGFAEVPNKVVSHKNLDDLENDQVEADNDLFQALSKVEDEKAEVARVKQIFAAATLLKNQAEQKAADAEQKVEWAAAKKEKAEKSFKLAAKTLQHTQEILELTLLEKKNAAEALAEAKRNVADAEHRFDRAQSALTQAERELVDAKDELRKCVEDVRTANSEVAKALKEYNLALKNLLKAENDLEISKRRKEEADQAVALAKDELDLVEQAVDNARSDLNKAEHALTTAETNLINAIQLLKKIQGLYVIAKDELADAKWIYEDALAALYRAQARKEIADRATAIALAETSASDHNVNYGSRGIGASGYGFQGCSAGVFPATAGSSIVTAVDAEGYSLSNGQRLVFGSCTDRSKERISVGGPVSWRGYYNNGIINAVYIRNWK